MDNLKFHNYFESSDGERCGVATVRENPFPNFAGHFDGQRAESDQDSGQAADGAKSDTRCGADARIGGGETGEAETEAVHQPTS